MKTKVDATAVLLAAGWDLADIKRVLGDDGEAEPAIVPPVQPLPYVPVWPAWPWEPGRQWWEPPYIVTKTDTTSNVVVDWNSYGGKTAQ